MRLKDRRHHHRHAMNLAGQLLLQGTAVPVCVRDVSLGGALIDTDAIDGYLLGMPCRLEISVPGPDLKTQLHGLIVHRECGCLGIKFIAVNDRQHSALLRILERSALPAHLIDREFPALLNAMERAPIAVG